MEALLVLLSSVACVFLLLAWKVINWVWLRPLKLQKQLREQGFSGAPYKLLHGDFKQMMSCAIEANSKPIQLSHKIGARVLPFIHYTVEKYGKKSIQWHGPTPRVNILEPEVMKDLMTNHLDDVTKPVANPFQKLIVTGIAIHEGKEWVKHRKLINPAFHIDKLKMMFPAFQASCDEFIQKWEKLVSDENSCEVDVSPDFLHYTGSVISRTAFGADYEQGQRIFALQSEQAELFVQSAQSLYLPGFRFLPTKRNNRMKEIDEKIRSILKVVVDEREQLMRNGDANNNDILGLLMESYFIGLNGDEQAKKAGMSIDDVIEECKFFYFAGQDSSQSLLVWTMILLSLNPDWQEKAREEVFQVFEKRKPDYTGLDNLKIVSMILYEVLRLYPPGPSFTRVTTKEMKIGDICLPAGVQIELPILLIHHDPQHWGEDAEEFNPERFSEGFSKARNTQASFVPFSLGPRRCVAQNFVMLEVKLAICMILQRFWFKLSPTYAHAPHFILTLKPQHGAPIILHKL